MTKANTATIGHNEAPEEKTLQQVAAAAFSKEKIALKAVKSKEENHTLLLDRLTADGALPGFNLQDDDKAYNAHAVACRTAWVASRGAEALRAWESENPTKTERKVVSSLIKQVGSRMRKLSEALEKHQSGEDKVKLTFTGRLIEGIEKAHYRISQYDAVKHGATTFDHKTVKATLEEVLVELKK